MTKYTYAERVVKKIRQLLKQDTRVNELINLPPTIQLNSNFCLDYLYWTYYDIKLIVTSTAIQLSSPTDKQVIFRYNSFDDLLLIK